MIYRNVVYKYRRKVFSVKSNLLLGVIIIYNIIYNMIIIRYNFEFY